MGINRMKMLAMHIHWIKYRKGKVVGSKDACNASKHAAELPVDFSFLFLLSFCGNKLLNCDHNQHYIKWKTLFSRAFISIHTINSKPFLFSYINEWALAILCYVIL